MLELRLAAIATSDLATSNRHMYIYILYIYNSTYIYIYLYIYIYIYIYIGVYASTRSGYPYLCPCARVYLLENENDKKNETYVGPYTTVPKRTNMRDTHPHLEGSNWI